MTTFGLGTLDRSVALPCLGLAEAIARLQSPYANEAWSVLTGAAVLAVDATLPGMLPSADALAAVDRRSRL